MDKPNANPKLSKVMNFPGTHTHTEGEGLSCGLQLMRKGNLSG